jgi:RNA polymerase primary sigma factor
MPPETERRLVVAAQNGDAAARARLVDEFMPLIASVARIYRNAPAVDRQELLQEGVVGLLRAIERYDSTRGTPFWAYASSWVRQAMQQLVAELSRPTVLSDRALRHLARVKDAHSQFLADVGREPSLAELAAAAGLTIEQVGSVLAVDRAPRSTNETLTIGDGAVETIGDLVADPQAEEEYDGVVTSVAATEIRDLLTGLPDRERMIVQARHGLDGEEQSLRQIAGRLGVSAERVRQLEQRAVGTLATAAGVA